ncbi:MAG: putative CAAX prenyl protease 1, partial [Streblomastix strix]
MLPVPLLTIGLYVAQYTLTIYIVLRNLQWHKRPDVPKFVKYVMPESDFRRMSNYAITKSKVKFFFYLYDVSLMLFIIFGKIYPKIWLLSGRIVLKYFGTALIWQTSIFVIIDNLWKLIFYLPFSMYNVFVVEQKFGFNKSSISLFISDIIKNQSIGVIMNLLMINIISWLIEERFGGDYYWVVAFGAYTAYTLVMGIIAPIFIDPLFEKSIPLEQIDQEMYQAVKQVCNKCDFDTKHIIVSEGSKRSAHSNAQIMDIFGIRKVILFDTLVELAGVDCSVKFKELQNKKKDETKPLLNIEQSEQNNQNDKNKEEETKIAIPKLFDNNNIIAAISHEIGHQKHNR